MKPIRNSTLSGFRNFIEGTEIDRKFLEKYFRFGTLMDHLITEEEKVDLRQGKLIVRTSYDEENYFFNSNEVTLAQEMLDSFNANPLLSNIKKHGVKHEFDNKFTFSFEGQTYEIPTQGELDLFVRIAKMGFDHKVTACATYREFYAKCLELYYDQQMAFYMDNMGIDRFVIAGGSKKSKDKNGLPEYFIITIDRNHELYISGKKRYTYWAYQYLRYHNLLDQCRIGNTGIIETK